MSGYYPSPWPCEDGGPQRLQAAPSSWRLNLAPGDKLGCVARDVVMSTMTVLGDPGEVFLLSHTALRSRLGLPTTSQVERIDPVTLKTIDASPRLPGGPMWPGGMAVHANGDLYVVYGRYAHRLDRRCRLKASMKLPLAMPYNSFVVLDNGLIVAKNLSETEPARLTVIDPNTMSRACADAICPEPSIARLSAMGDAVYVVGVRSIFRFHWDGAGLAIDPRWRFDYAAGTQQSFGWDVVLDGTHAWFMDNGKHRYATNMIGRGVVQTPNRLLRVSMSDSDDHSAVEVCGMIGGSITNPPAVDPISRRVIGYDSANRRMQSWTYGSNAHMLQPGWAKADFACASHMILSPNDNALITNDFGRRGEEVVVLDARTGEEMARARVGGLTQGVVFPSIGWARDFYWSSMSKLARIFVS